MRGWPEAPKGNPNARYHSRLYGKRQKVNLTEYWLRTGRIDTKFCIGCKQIKSLGAFYANKDGMPSSMCRMCCNKYDYDRKAAKREAEGKPEGNYH